MYYLFLFPLEMGRSSADAEVRQMPKFGRCRSSAEEFGRMFGSATFGIICGFAFATFCARRWR